jgi:hypothetical protein
MGVMEVVSSRRIAQERFLARKNWNSGLVFYGLSHIGR